MTCIVGLVDGGKVWIGGDSAGASGWDVAVRADAKVFTKGPMAFGFTTSFRMGQLLRYRLNLPAHEDGVDVEAYMVTSFVDAVRETLKAGGWTKIDNGREDGGTFLVGYAGHLYAVYDDFQVAERADAVNAVGCGAAYALGALHAAKGPARRRITTALTAAEWFSGAVAAPFEIVSVK